MNGDQAEYSRQTDDIPAVLPPNATWLTVGAIGGWHYELYDPYGRRFEFFVWSDGSVYHVSIVDPPLEVAPDAGVLRVRSDGRLQPFDQTGSTTLLSAFQGSLAWLAYRAIRERVANSVASDCGPGA